MPCSLQKVCESKTGQPLFNKRTYNTVVLNFVFVGSLNKANF